MNKVSIVLALLITLSIIAPATAYTFVKNTARAGRPTLVFGLPDIPVNGFNPLSFKMVYTEVVADAMFEPLIRTKWDFNGYIPNLAKSWEVQDDGKVWIFYLVDNATWHDGQPVTADDVVYTYNLIKQYVEFQGGRENFVAKLTSVEKVDDYTVKFTFSEKVTEAETVFSQVYIVPKHVWETLSNVTADLSWDKLIGCGPFKYESSEPDTIILTAYDNHFRGAPEPQKLEFKKVGDFVSKLVAGEIDAGYFSTYKASEVKQLATLANEGKAVLYKTLGSTTHMLIFNLEKEPMSFLAFRYAVLYAVNTTRILEKYFGNLALPGNQALLNPKGYQYTFYVEKEKVYPCNKTLARLILEKALGLKDVNGDGYYEDPNGNPIVVKILAKQNDVFSRDLIAQDIAADLRDVGINAQADIVPADQFGDKYNSRDWDMVVIGWFLPAKEERYGKPPVTTFGEFTTGSEANVPRFSNDTYDSLYQQFVQAVNNNQTDQMVQLAHELQKILLIQAPAVALYHPYVVTAVRTDKYSDWVISLNYALNYYSYIGASKFGLTGPVKYGEMTGEQLLQKAHVATPDEINQLKDIITKYLKDWGVIKTPTTTSPAPPTTSPTSSPPPTTSPTTSSPTTKSPTGTKPTKTTTPPPSPDYTLYIIIAIVIIIIIAIALFLMKKK